MRRHFDFMSLCASTHFNIHFPIYVLILCKCIHAPSNPEAIYAIRPECHGMQIIYMIRFREMKFVRNLHLISLFSYFFDYLIGRVSYSSIEWFQVPIIALHVQWQKTYYAFKMRNSEIISIKYAFIQSHSDDDEKM